MNFHTYSDRTSISIRQPASAASTLSMPPRASRRTTHTYNLTSGSSRSAFEHGLDYHDDFDDDDIANTPSLLGTSPASRGRGMTGQRRSAQPVFAASSNIRNTDGHGALLNGQGTERQTVDLVNLIELFPAVDRHLIEEVLSGCDFMFDRALDLLSEMQAPPNPLACGMDVGGATGDMGCTRGAAEFDGHGGSYWTELPEDVKDIIMGMLPARSVAMAAATCMEFSQRVKLGATNARVLTIPMGLSLNGIIGMVAGHPNAHTVSLTRWSQQVLPVRDFAALLTAISSGSRSSRRNWPVESISFKGWSSLTDGDVMTLCSTMQHLKEVDLSDCTGITDAALLELSKYQRQAQLEAPDDLEEEEAAAAAAVAGSRVGGGGGLPGKGSKPVGAGDCGDTLAGGEGEDDLQFEMEGPAPSAPKWLQQAQGARPSLACAADSGSGMSAVPPAPLTPPCPLLGPAGEEEGWVADDEEDDEDLRQAMLASLAELAASPPISRLEAGSDRLLQLTSSPPSSLMMPDRALGSQMARIGLGVPHRPPLGRADAMPVPLTGRSSSSNGGGGGSGWVGAWARGTLGSSPAGAAASPAATSGSSHGCSPGVTGTSPLTAATALQLWPPPRMSTAAGPGLRSLVLAGCSGVSAEGVRLLLAAPGRKACLEALDISRCQRMTRQALLVPPMSCLRTLKCAGCNSLHEVVIQLPPTCPLTELHLNNCKQLAKLQLVAPNLKLLHLGGCKNMVSMSLRCPQLTQLLANLCFRWTGVTTEQWNCPRLQHLNLFGARHLETASLAAILQQSPGIRSINLNGCNTVSTIEISEDLAELAALDVSGCKGLVSLRVAGRCLGKVEAKSCPRLQEVRLESPILTHLDVSHCSQLQTLQIVALQQQQQQQGDAFLPPGDVALAAAVTLPRLTTFNAERMLPQATLLRLRAVNAARRAAAAGDAAERRATPG